MKLSRRTKRLVVRPIEAKDYLAWRLAHSTMLPQQNIWDRKPSAPEDLTRAKFRKMLQTQARLRKNDSFYQFAVFTRDGTMIGAVSAMNVVRGVSQTAFVGYGIFNRYWGRGYAKEAVRALLDIGFGELNLHRMEAGVEPTNRRSILLARALKMRKEGCKKRALFLRGAWQDLVIYTLTSEELGIRWKNKT